MECIFISGEEYENQIVSKKYDDLFKQLSEELKLAKKDEKCVVIHPTTFTQNLLDIAENEVHFQKIVTALTTEIDVKKMYAFGLFNILIERDRNCNDKYESVFSDLFDIFCHSELVGKLQEFIRQTINCGEVLGWLPMGEKDGYPYVPKHYVIIFVPSTGEYVSRDIFGNDIKINFLNELGKGMKPQSTVAFMREKYYTMQMIRVCKMMSFHYASRPLYVTRDREKRTDGEVNEKSNGNLLDVKLVNQHKVNETLEKMIDDTDFGSMQKTVSRKNDLNKFLQQISNEMIENNKENSLLKQKIQEIKNEEKGDVLFKAFSRHLEGGTDMAGSNLSVPRMCIADEEHFYEREWICAAFGGTDASMISGSSGAKHSTAPRHRGGDTNREKTSGEHQRSTLFVSDTFLEKKAVHYQNVIIYEQLSEWMRRHDIPLSVIPRQSKSSNLTNILQIKPMLSPSFFTVLLSHAIDVPLHFLSKTAKLEEAY